MSLLDGISGYTIVRNAITLDYCIELAIQSLLPVCNEVVVCDSDSTDGTRAMLDAWAAREPCLRIVNRPWPAPVNQPRWFVEWINEARQHLRYSSQLMLDADEVLDEAAYPLLLQASGTHTCYQMRRLNFWHDASHLIPEGQVCGHLVSRFGPTHLYMPSDEPYGAEPFPEAAPEITTRSVTHPSLRIYHYGFLRHREAIFAKNAVNLTAFRGSWDSRLSRARLHPNLPWQSFYDHGTYPAYTGTHPTHCHQWLKDRHAL